MTLRSQPARALLALAALSLAAAACGSDDNTATTATSAVTTTTSAPEATTTTAPETTSTTAVGGTAVEIGDSDLGQILVSEGRTLYTFAPDNAGAPTCNGDCAVTWPPLLADGAVAPGDGLDAALFATVAREDGSLQVTVDGWPVYMFANDAAPGDVNGQGLGDVWHAVAPSGAAIGVASSIRY